MKYFIPKVEEQELPSIASFLQEGVNVQKEHELELNLFSTLWHREISVHTAPYEFMTEMLSEDLLKRIKLQIRKNASPRHVPHKIIKVNDIPRTKSGKIVELAVKNIIEGNKIKNKEALANAHVLDEFSNIKELQY